MSDQDDADRPATFREVLASGEYRALYLASALSWFGDYVARAAITALVYQRTGSVAASAAAFAISYVPWLGFGPVLAALAERLPYRHTMIAADLARMVFVALVAIPGMPIWAMITLLFLTSLGNPPFDASRSALLAKVLTGDRYVVGMTLQTTSHQAAQIAGYLSGAGLATVNAQVALLLNAATFGVSAALILFQVGHRPPALAKKDRTHLLRETASGLKLVFTAPLLRGVAIVVFLTALFAVVPEGLAAAWAASLSTGEDSTGWVQGAIMISNPVGFIVGGLVVGRLLRPKRRQRLVSAFAVAVPASLTPALFDLPVAGVLVLCFFCGAATAAVIPATNGLFVQALPNAYRARAFGVMKSGIQVLQGLGVFVTGYLADRFALHTVVGVWGLFGVGLMVIAIVTWPKPQQIADEIARAQAMNKASEEAESVADDEPPTPAGQRDPEREIWGFPVAGQLGRAVGRSRVVTQADIAEGAAAYAEGQAGRQGRRRISRPVGRIYSTGTARVEGADESGAQPSRPSRLRPKGLAGDEPIEPLGAPGTDLMGAAAAAGLLGEPAVTDPQWYPLAEAPGDDRTEQWPPAHPAGWDPETRAQRAHHRAVQQHAAHQQRRAEQTHRGDQRP